MIGSLNQEQVFLDGWVEVKGKRRKFLDHIDRIVDWKSIEKRLHKLYSNKGRPSHPPMVAFKMLLLQHFYNLSDPACEEAVNDSLAFRHFCGLGFSDAIPDETTLVRFRMRLIKKGLHTELLNLVNRSLDKHGVGVRKVTLVDASIIESSVSRPKKNEESKDPDAAWTKKKEKLHHGYKAHVACEAATHLIRGVEYTSGNVHDSRVFDEFDDGEHPMAADKAYYSKEREARLGERSYLMRRGARNRPLSDEEHEYNKMIGRIRGRIEKIFGHWKRSMGYRRTRYRGLSPGRLELELKSICWNLKRAVTLLG